MAESCYAPAPLNRMACEMLFGTGLILQKSLILVATRMASNNNRRQNQIQNNKHPKVNKRRGLDLNHGWRLLQTGIINLQIGK